MRTILVTGANKGIGLGIARAILREQADTRLLLGSRDARRGEAARATLVGEDAAFAARIEAVTIDVSSDASVSAARTRVRELLGPDGRLYALVNNAGVGIAPELRSVLEVNCVGMQRACEAFLPLLDATYGRIVNVTSAAGPNFVGTCSAERKRFFLSADGEWADIEALLQECLALEGDAAAFARHGLGDGAAYGLSKACANTYTLQLARRHPELKINACTPGFIETDMTRQMLAGQDKTPSELGLKTPDQGARSTMHLLFSELHGNGRYYGSDSKRSPLDRYRAPGDPEYTGD